jgi:uncharacterized protein YggE
MSYYYSGQSTIEIKTKGSADAAFKSARFEAKITTIDKTGPAAKAKAKDRIAAIWHVIQSFAYKADIDTDRLRTTFAVDSHKEHDRTTGDMKFMGYRATYTISFTGRNVLEAIGVHDALTSIEGVESPSPIFEIDESPEVHARAFAAAFKAAGIKFGMQLDATGLGAVKNEFVLRTWGIDEEQSRGKMLSVGNGPAAESVGIEPGKATLEMNVTFVFERVKK